MHDDIIIQRAAEEISVRKFGTTQQILEIHEVVHENGSPLVLRVDNDKDKDVAIVYFQIKEEQFHLAVYLDKKPDIAIRSVGIQAYHSIYFSASSDKLSQDELLKLTTLAPTDGWYEGDKRKFGSATYKNSRLIFEPDPGPFEFETKMSRMLDFLEKDKEGVGRLVDLAEGYIQVATVFHNGNTMLGGHYLNKSTILRLAQLNLGIDFDENAEGNLFIE